MIIKLSTLVNAQGALARLAGTKLPAKAAWRVGVILKKVDPLLVEFRKANEDLVRKHGEPVENTDNLRVRQENMPAFMAELNDLLEMGEELDFVKLRLSDLGEVEVTPADLMALEFMIDGDS
jgi:hypothetical protein